MKHVIAVLASLLAVPAVADTVRVGISSDMASTTVETPDGPVEISRDQTPGAKLSGDWALTGRDCPPFCIQPISPAEGVSTIGELELLDGLKSGTILVDSRTPDWYVTGTIPGAINIPYTQAVERLAELGCDPDFDGKFDCTDVTPVMLFCNGLWCGQSPTAIRAMIEAGFPADKISYYRGGMQSWRLLGLTVAGGAQSDAPAAAAGDAGTTDPIGAADPSPAEGSQPGTAQDNMESAADENQVTDGRTESAAKNPQSDAPVDGTTPANEPAVLDAPS